MSSAGFTFSRRLTKLISTELVFRSVSSTAAGSGMAPYSKCLRTLIRRLALGCSPPTTASISTSVRLPCKRVDRRPMKTIPQRKRVNPETE